MKSKKLISAVHNTVRTNTNTEKHRLSLTPLTAGVFCSEDYHCGQEKIPQRVFVYARRIYP